MLVNVGFRIMIEVENEPANTRLSVSGVSNEAAKDFLKKTTPHSLKPYVARSSGRIASDAHRTRPVLQCAIDTRLDCKRVGRVVRAPLLTAAFWASWMMFRVRGWSECHE